MKHIILYLFVTLLVYDVAAQFKELRGFTYKNNTYDVCIMTVDTSLCRRFSIVDNKSRINEAGFFSSLSTEGTFCAITACITDAACNPLGLCISKGIMQRDINRDTGSGTFFQLTNGFIAISHDKIQIAESAAWQASPDWQWAVQTGPMLVSNGVINSAFNKNSTNRHLRCGIGLYNAQNTDYLVIVKSAVPVSFYDIASLFAEKYGCKNALGLESGGNVSMHLPSVALSYRASAAPCVYVCVQL